MRKLLLSTLTLAVLSGASTRCPAQFGTPGETKTLVTVSFAGYDQLRGGLDAVFEAAKKLTGVPPEAKMFVEMAQQSLPPAGNLPGIDPQRPWGLLVQTDGMQFFPLGFIPVTNLQQALPLLAPTGIQPEDNGDGTYTIQTPAMPLLVKEQNGWAFIVSSPTALAKLPADPVTLLDGLDKKYNLAVRGSVQNVPPMFRQLAVSQLKGFVESQLEPLPGESDDDYAIRVAVARRSLDQIITTINELDSVLLGWNLDSSTVSTYLDFEVTAVPGTTTAAQYAALGQAKTNFAGFDLPGAAVTGNWAGTISDEAAEQVTAELTGLRDRTIAQLADQGLTDEDIALATQVITDLSDVALATIAAKQADGGMVLMLKPESATFAAGGALVGGDKLEAALKKFVARLSQDSPELAGMVKFDAETYKGIRFHVVTLPAADPRMQTLVGDTLTAIVGVGDKAVYVCGGRDAAAVLKQVIDASAAAAGKTIPPARISVSMAALAQFAAAESQGPDQEFNNMLAAVLGQSNGKDHVNLTVRPVPNGVGLRLEIEQGLLTLLPIIAPRAVPPPGPGGMEEIEIPGAAPADSSPF